MTAVDLTAIRARLAEHEAATLIGDAWVARMARLGEFVPALIAEVERLRRDVALLRTGLDHAVGHLHVTHDYRGLHDRAGTGGRCEGCEVAADLKQVVGALDRAKP